jgi:putative tryptophan/tyrosine transport system substrate-binding protein
MRRRDFLIASGAASAWPLLARADEAKRIPKVGMLWLSSPEVLQKLGYIDDFPPALKDLGYIEGKNYVLEMRFAERRLDRLPSRAAELINLPVDVIVAAREPLLAAIAAKTTLPIVAIGLADPVGLGVAESLAHPGGHVTGIALFDDEMQVKRLELLTRVVPGLRSVGLLAVRLYMPQALKQVAGFASSANIEIRPIVADGPSEYEPAIAEAAGSIGALLVYDSTTAQVDAATIQAAAIKHRLPTTSGADFGALLGYGHDIHWALRQAAGFVAKILGGAKPGDLPFERPTHFRTVVNLRIAKALGIEIPPDVLAAADELIE